MASSGTLTGSFGGSSGSHFTLVCNWAIQSQSTANRTSYVRFDWAVRKDWSYRTYKNPAAWSQTIDGSSASGTVNFDIPASLVNTDLVYATTYATIQHNANGTKTATISGTLDLSGTSAGVGSLSGSIVLDAIHVDPPTVDSFTLSDAGTGQSTVGAWVATKSRIQLTASATAVEAGATIANYAFYANNTLLQSGSAATYTGANTATAGSYVFKVVVTDSYGLTAEQSLASITVLAYANPTIQTETFRCDSSGNAERLGTYVRCKATWTISAVGSNAVVLHRVTVDGTNTDLTNGTAVTLGGSLALNQVYDIEYIVTDKFGTEARQTDQILQGKYDSDYHPDGGVAFGTYAEAGKLKTTYDIETSGDATIQGNLNLADFGAFIANGATQYRDQLSVTGSGWNYRYGTVTGDGVLMISLSAQKTGGSVGASLVVGIAKQNGSSYDEYAVEWVITTSDATYQQASNAAAFMKVTNGDKIRLGVYRNSISVTASTDIVALGATVALDSGFAV